MKVQYMRRYVNILKLFVNFYLFFSDKIYYICCEEKTGIKMK